MKVKIPTSKTFRHYGKIIEYPQQKKNARGMVRNLWKIIHTELGPVGWRVAYLVLRDKSIGRMECHPNSDETFEPVRGRFLMFISKTRELKDIQVFEIDKPVIVFKGIWHGVVAIGAEAEIKITENADVACQYWRFGFRLTSAEDLEKRLG